MANSFLFFYGGFLLLLLARDFSAKRKGESVKNRPPPHFTLYALRFIAKWAFKHSLLVLFPVLFYIAEKSLLGEPYGIYKGYNLFVFLYPGVSIQKIIFLLTDRTWQSIAYGFFWPVLAPISILQRKIFAVLFMGISIFLYFLIRRCVSGKQNESDASPIAQQGLYTKYFFAGCVLFILGFIPYVLVGESPNPHGHGFDMRHGLLLPLGSALIILALIRIFLAVKWHLSATAGIFALCITFNIFNYYSIDMDSYKQLGIIESLRSKFEAHVIAKDAIVAFHDELPLYNWRGRKLEDFEYTAYLYEASGSDEALGTLWRKDLYFDTSFMFTFKGVQERPRDEELKQRLVYANIVSSSLRAPTFTNWLKLKKTDLFGNQKELTDLIKNLLAINVIIPSR